MKVLGIEARLEASSSAIYPAGTAEDLAEAVCSQKRSYAERAKESKEHISARLDYAAGLKGRSTDSFLRSSTCTPGVDPSISFRL